MYWQSEDGGKLGKPCGFFSRSWPCAFPVTQHLHSKRDESICPPNKCANILTVALFVKPQHWKTTKYPSAVRWINKEQYSHAGWWWHSDEDRRATTACHSCLCSWLSPTTSLTRWMGTKPPLVPDTCPGTSRTPADRVSELVHWLRIHSSWDSRWINVKKGSVCCSLLFGLHMSRPHPHSGHTKLFMHPHGLRPHMRFPLPVNSSPHLSLPLLPFSNPANP